MSEKKIIGIRYHYDDHTSEYITDLSTTSVINFNWLNLIIGWFKKKED